MGLSLEKGQICRRSLWNILPLAPPRTPHGSPKHPAKLKAPSQVKHPAQFSKLSFDFRTLENVLVIYTIQ
jgi:hypothetical protein